MKFILSKKKEFYFIWCESGLIDQAHVGTIDLLIRQHFQLSDEDRIKFGRKGDLVGEVEFNLPEKILFKRGSTSKTTTTMTAKTTIKEAARFK